MHHFPEYSSGRGWWRFGVVYQLYVQSFADSDGDGIGDLPGALERLEHVAQLGCDAVWLTPFYPSPMIDGGYDVRDHRDVNPPFGTLEDVDALVRRAHGLGLKVVVDIVPNHTSSEHPWFQAALSAGPGSAARERYVFRDGRGPDGAQPPTDWQSWFGTSAWERVEDGQWYLHLFDVTQPDLNWDHPEVRADFERTLRFWGERGVDGFRVDVASGLAKDLAEPLRDDGGRFPYELSEVVDGSHPIFDRDEVHDIFRRWRRVLDEFDPPKAAVAEVEGARSALYARRDELGQAFTTELMELEFDGGAWREAIATCLANASDTGTLPAWVLSNHDVVRHASRYALPDGTDRNAWKLSRGRTPAADTERGLRRARAATMLMLALPGAAYLYQGEELGLPEVYDLDPDVLQHPMWERSGHAMVGHDGCRVPLPWEPHGPSLGFGPAAGWLPQPPSFASYAVAAQAGVAGSTLELYRSALRLRRELNAGGTFEWLDAGRDVVAFRRAGGWASWTNFGVRDAPLPRGRVALSSAPGERDHLAAESTVWVARS